MSSTTAVNGNINGSTSTSPITRLFTAVAARVASSTTVAPYTAAPRVLNGVPSTNANAQIVVQEAQLIEQEREHVQASTSQPSLSPTQAYPVTLSNTGTGTIRQKKYEEKPFTSMRQVQNLEQIGKNIRAINSARRTVETGVAAFVAQGVDTAVHAAAQQLAQATTTSAKVFDRNAREQKLAELRTQAAEKGSQLATQISQSVLGGTVEPQGVDPVLKSSMQDIAQLVQAESGVPVTVPLGARELAQTTDTIQSANQDIAKNQGALAQRDGLALYRDSDRDGISDYDEEHIYHTDPHSAYTGGGVLTDGERVLLGLDPHVSAIAPVPVQSPVQAGVETSAVFEVLNIALVSGGATSTLSASTSASIAPSRTGTTSPQQSAAAGTPQGIRFSGRALPNSFVTLYVFSDPIVVTVKTDQNGLWTYVLNKPLPDGSHELYVATVDDQGKILAKSPAVPFVKTAEALSYSPLFVQEPSSPSFLDTLRTHLVAAGAFLALAFVLFALLALGFRGTGNVGAPLS